MSEERKTEILNNLLGWIAMHDEEFIECAIKAMGITKEEAIELELVEEN